MNYCLTNKRDTHRSLGAVLTEKNIYCVWNDNKVDKRKSKFSPSVNFQSGEDCSVARTCIRSICVFIYYKMFNSISKVTMSTKEMQPLC